MSAYGTGTARYAASTWRREQRGTIAPMLTSAPTITSSAAFAGVCTAMVETVRLLSARGWTPATSSNFSTRIPGWDDGFAVTRSGVDKATFAREHVMLVDRAGRTVWPDGARSSAETPIHAAMYELFDAGAVVHTHSVNATAISLLHAAAGIIQYSGLELLKGFRGISTHEASVDVPIYPNDQDMDRFAAMIRRELRGENLHGFLIAGHGLYTWGQDLGEARRHAEVFEFLFELTFRLNGFKQRDEGFLTEGYRGSADHSR
jgi:methylthioribulose-1-phosphate dehydratase